MPPCLLSQRDQPPFVETSESTNHISEVHSNVLPNPAGHLRQPAVRCYVCNKKFNTSFGLASHQKAKEHYPSRPALSPKFTNSEELARKSETCGGSSSSTAVDVNGITSKPDVTQHCVTHRCDQCQTSCHSLIELETHRSSHGNISCSKCSCLFSSLVEWNDHFKQVHQNTQFDTRQEESAPDFPPTSRRGSSPDVVRPASSQSVSNKDFSSNVRGKGPVVCDICKKELKSQAGLQAHTAAKHPAGMECIICHIICPSTAALEGHVDSVHSCAVCQDGILRDAQTLSDHMAVHSHPISCKRCGTRYQTEEDRNLHFVSTDNDHPTCLTCRLGFEDDNALRAHMGQVHTSPTPNPKLSPEPSIKIDPAARHCRTFQCDVCHEDCLSQTELDVHVVTAHSCPICHDGIYLDMRTLEDHLERHRSPFACHSCGLSYAKEDQLFAHYKDSPSDLHPRCEKCHVGFENIDSYTVHVDEVHPRIACDICEGEFFDSEDLAVHYMSSRKHPKCEKCSIGFRDQTDFTDHGASAHPECHCYLCQWHFDTPDILQNHIRHFFNHPKCKDCNIRFPDADAYQYHLFTVHRPYFGDEEHVSAAHLDCENKLTRCDFASSLSSAQATDPIWGFEGSASLPYASFIPLPPSLSGYSSPTSQRVTTGSCGSSGSHSRSSTLSVDQRSSNDGQPWNATLQSLSLDIGQDLKTSPEFDQSPLSTLPAVGTPLISSAPTVQSADFGSPFSPRPEPPTLFSLSQEINGTSMTVTECEFEDADSGSNTSFARSPPLISPVVKLPDPGGVSPSSTSSWTMTSDADSRRSSPQRGSISSSKGVNGTFSASRTATSDNSTPHLSLLVPSSTQLTLTGSGSNSGCPSSISPESAGISISASMTPEYIREARAYLSLTHQIEEPPSPQIAPSPRISSPILSSTGLAIGDRGRRREVRFEDNIMAESAWDRQSTSSDSSFEPPVIPPRPGNLKINGISKLPRFSALKRPTRKWTNGQASNVSARAYRRSNGTSSSYHCRSCYKDHCEEPTTTTCGHLFCYGCISSAIMRDPRCPVCDAPTLLYCLFRIDTSA